ncbi:MAG: 4'-phosphopantetheinyl transferase superfamily protein [Clostridia bacterium]|nr:4'-phosphopantetheinyl transferase superfamily protein [Clostridia bacterium]
MLIFFRRVSVCAPEPALRTLPPALQEELLACGHTGHRNQRIAAAALCRDVLAAESGMARSALSILRTPAGKPFCPDTPLRFSLSHSGDLVAMAVSDREIGVDLERLRPVRLDAARRIAVPAELDYIGDDPRRFLQIWTLKEAYFKCIGTGLMGREQEISFSVGADGTVACSDPAAVCRFHPSYPDYLCAVCELK